MYKSRQQFLKSTKSIKNTSSKVLCYVVKNDTERNGQNKANQKGKCLRTRWGLFPAKFLTTSNELGQRKKSQIRYYKDMLLTGNRQ